jgi:prolipoprotein diacylglyceryl transferase
VFAPLSIPSPDYEFQEFEFGQWLRDIGLSWFTFDFSIRAYAVCIIVGIIAAVIITSRRLTARGAEPGIVLDIILFAVPLGIIGARIFHVLTHPSDYFGEGKNFLEVFAIWNGGIAIFGALIGGAVGAWIGCKLTGVRFWSFADALAPAMLVAQAFGRLGNWFNHELYGTPTDLPWGLEIEASNPAFPIGLEEGTLFHPTFLYEILWNLAGVAVLLYLERQWSLGKRTFFGITVPVPVGGRVRLRWGKLFALYLIWYGLGRIVWETIRIDPSEVVFGLRTNVWASIFAILVGIVVYIVQSRRHFGDEPSVYTPGREWVAVVDSEETYSDIVEPGNGAKALSEQPAVTTSGPAKSGSGTKS